jgi:hypothetical protein
MSNDSVTTIAEPLHFNAILIRGGILFQSENLRGSLCTTVPVHPQGSLLPCVKIFNVNIS